MMAKMRMLLAHPFVQEKYLDLTFTPVVMICSLLIHGISLTRVNIWNQLLFLIKLRLLLPTSIITSRQGKTWHYQIGILLQLILRAILLMVVLPVHAA